MRSFNCHRCGGTIKHARETGRLPWYCQPCVKEKEVERIRARCEVDKAIRRESRDPDCQDCGNALVFDDSNPLRMDMHTICHVCTHKRKLAEDARYRLKKGHKPTGTMAEIKKAAAERRAAEASAKAVRLANQKPKHGLSATPAYRSWNAARNRCTNPNHAWWYCYGGRGIRMSKEFAKSFEAFYDYIGPRPPGYSLDRIDPNGDYCRGNIRWQPRSHDSLNRRPPTEWRVHPSVSARKGAEMGGGLRLPDCCW